ncbi:FMN-binding protein [Kribbella soli]|uniref:FMN-binding protein n=2 Tax=Kribbella soli TaxID=1124743 RepID=A0A4R0HCP0_9ACTN|nr:FMN-binding protein [Kribbella soli]
MTVATTAVVAVAFRASAQPNTTSGQATVVSSGPARDPSARPSESSRDSRRKPPSARSSASPRRSTPTVPRASTPTPSSVVVAGGVVDTQYGPVQVEVTVRGGRIAKARALQHPSGGGETDQINSYAVPQLDHETLAAQSANIDTVSGATFTSDGYRQSLQSALDAAHQAGAR